DPSAPSRASRLPGRATGFHTSRLLWTENSSHAPSFSPFTNANGSPMRREYTWRAALRSGNRMGQTDPAVYALTGSHVRFGNKTLNSYRCGQLPFYASKP